MSRHGFSLVEVVVGVALLAIVSYGFFAFQNQTFKMVRVVSDNAALAKALTSIERDVSADVPFLPPQENDDDAKASVHFNDPLKADVRCYDKTGARIATCTNFENEPVAYFRTRFYKAQVLDASLDSTSPMARIPLSRVRFKLEYKVSNKLQEPMYFTRLYTDALRY